MGRPRLPQPRAPVAHRFAGPRPSGGVFAALAWLRGLFSGSCRSVPGPVAHLGSKRPTFQPCPRCRGRVRCASPRCPHCGAWTQTVRATAGGEPSRPVAPAGDPTADGPIPPARVTDLRRRILLAALDSSQKEPSIRVHRPASNDEGEIKAGSVRVYGDDAVRAVEQLLGEGFLAERGPAEFDLSEQGRRLAAALGGPRDPSLLAAGLRPGLP